MSAFKHLGIALIASTILIVGPVLGCCSGMPDSANSMQTAEFVDSNSATPQHAPASGDMQMPCHEMAMSPEPDPSSLDTPAPDTGHCDNCVSCITTLAQETSVVTLASAASDSDFEAMYFLVLLEFPGAKPEPVLSDKPPDDLLTPALTPVSLHQILTI